MLIIMARTSAYILTCVFSFQCSCLELILLYHPVRHDTSSYHPPYLESWNSRKQNKNKQILVNVYIHRILRRRDDCFIPFARFPSDNVDKMKWNRKNTIVSNTKYSCVKLIHEWNQLFLEFNLINFTFRNI